MKRKIIFIARWAVCFPMLALFGGQGEVVFAGEQSHQLVSAHTSGSISREGRIQVQFVADMADPAAINMPLKKSPFLFKPEIKGTAIWTTPHNLEFWPKDRLPAAQAYTATLNLSQITETAGASKTFEFPFIVMKQSFELTIDGLQASSRVSLKELQLTGKLTTADVESSPSVIKLLKAEQAGKGLNIRWTHDLKRRKHSFVIGGISRGDTSSDVILSWDGTPIGMEKRGSRAIPVPPIGPFKVLGVRVVHGDQHYVEVRFTDPLEKDQDLTGLIRVTPTEGEPTPLSIRFTIDGSILRVYSSTPWPEEAAVEVALGIRNILSARLGKTASHTVSFKDIKPEVRFVSTRVIIPTTRGLTLPIEAVNIRGMIVEATRIYENNMPQFFQVNTLEYNDELERVGRVVWKKLVPLDFTPDKKNQWIRYGLDLTPLVQKHPGGGFFRIRVSFSRRHIVYPCPDASEKEDDEPEISPDNWDEEEESSYWDYYEGNNDDYDGYWGESYERREDPCHRGYYRDYYEHNIAVSQNLLISDIGLIAKRGDDGVTTVVATDMKTAQPLPGVELRLADYQQQKLSAGKTDSHGMAILRSERKPFLLIAKHGKQFGYLKMDDGSALSVSHFDVSGQRVKKGLKGFIYGERGVWRPGDPIYLTFILLDNEKRLPKNHPIFFELRNPNDQVIESMRKRESLNGFYSFQTQTGEDALTGNWTARIRAGGTTFSKVLKIETVMPNRLKIGLDFGADALFGGKITGELSARWLHGATAKNLDADVEVNLRSARTAFPKYEEYVFDDPIREYMPETQVIFDEELDEKGKAAIKADIRAENVSPGMLRANFKTRVFEPGGAFSIDRFSIPYHPYDRYVGVRLPKGDKARGMLLTDTPHTTRIAMLDAEGEPVSKGEVEIKLYKIKWRWWWEKGRDSMAEYIDTSSHTPIRTDTLPIRDGKGEWQFEVKYPSWGRYLIRVCDTDGKHCTGKVFYMDWPGWAGRARKDMPGGASVLSFSSDKKEYKVGEKITLTIPTGKQGRALITIESGTKVIQAEWVESSGEKQTRHEFTATEVMAPNIYAHVSFLQPHLQTENDLPIRMYGVIPIRILDPGTRLDPEIETPETFVPEESAEITIREANGKPMTYTVAIVDEGLLDLTRFQTPAPWGHFYKREALGVTTWDIFDMVAGAYGGVLEQLLAIGGDDALINQGKKKAHRFPPMVRFMGPFALGKGADKTHAVDIPQYVGSVRVMVIAGQDGAFGSADKAVFVRKPLMVLATLPRVLGPDEEAEMPISVFAMEKSVKDVSVVVKTEGPLSLIGSPEKSIAFSEPGDEIIFFRVKAGTQVGIASVSVQATSGEVTAGQKIEIDIRMPGGTVTDVVDTVISTDEIWKNAVKFPGVSGTNKAFLEVSRIPPINLGKRLSFLIRYPHGCVEQTTSSVFPQLYLDKLLDLPREQQDRIQRNIKAGIQRLQTFQAADGGFLYWPGGNKAHDWSSSYAGHFLVEAEKAGYLLPPGLMAQWKTYQRKRAMSWLRDGDRQELIQAYRLYTLALASEPELGAMNRLREEQNLPAPAQWRLASAYLLAGQPEAAEVMVEKAPITVAAYQELSNTYGSDIRDKAMMLESLCLMNRMKQAKSLAKAISEGLSSGKPLSTQTTAYALIAMARHAGVAGDSKDMAFSFSWNKGEEETVSSKRPLVQMPLSTGDKDGGIITVKNIGGVMLYPRMILEGTPAVGKETAAAHGFKLEVNYSTLEGESLDPAKLDQGTDLLAKVKITNTGKSGTYEEVALSHLFPSGWEIRNMRMDVAEEDEGDEDEEEGMVPESDHDYQDIRDDRVHTYFDIKQGETKVFRTMANASYIGKFYLPMLTVEAMYDATINARIPGGWVSVVEPGE